MLTRVPTRVLGPPTYLGTPWEFARLSYYVGCGIYCNFYLGVHMVAR